MKRDIEALKQDVSSTLEALDNGAALQRYEFDILGRKGRLAALMKLLSKLPKDQRAAFGILLNDLKTNLTQAFKQKKKSIRGTLPAKRPTHEQFDVTLPGKRPLQGHLHPVTSAIEEIETIFTNLGFYRVRYNEVEWDYYAFEGLNMPADHPARDEWETFFITENPVGPLGRILLTPHTSSGQVREMQKHAQDRSPIRMLNIAKTYRRQIDISHLPMFHQFEGLVVDRQATLTQLLGVLDYFVKQFFSLERTMRVRPFHFRFTEPSFEVDISCALCAQAGCAYCKEGWVELGGAGMVHPAVLTAGGYDPREFTGFAFGFGVERCYMMKNNLNIGDLRLLYSSDIRFLEQF